MCLRFNFYRYFFKKYLLDKKSRSPGHKKSGKDKILAAHIWYFYFTINIFKIVFYVVIQLVD